MTTAKATMLNPEKSKPSPRHRPRFRTPDVQNAFPAESLCVPRQLTLRVDDCPAGFEAAACKLETSEGGWEVVLLLRHLAIVWT